MDIDLTLITWIQDVLGAESRLFWDIITNLGSAPVLVLIVGMVMWLGGTRNGLRVLFAFMFSTITVLLLKVLFLQPRPYYVYEEVQPWRDSDGLGMPSGHSGGAMALWGRLALAVSRLWVTLGATVLIFLIGLSRIYFGVHSPSQVLIGWVVGFIILLVVWRWEKPAVAFFKSLGWRKQLGLALITTLALVLIRTTVIGALAANYPPPRAWQDRHIEAQIYEASLEGEYPTEFEPLLLFGELNIDLIGAFFGMWLVVIFVAHRGGFEGFTARQRVANVVVGLISTAVLVSLTQVAKGVLPVEATLWVALPLLLGVGVPLVGERFR